MKIILNSVLQLYSAAVFGFCSCSIGKLNSFIEMLCRSLLTLTSVNLNALSARMYGRNCVIMQLSASSFCRLHIGTADVCHSVILSCRKVVRVVV